MPVQSELERLRDRRAELTRQVKHAKDNSERQKKEERRRHRKKEQGFGQLIPVFIAVLVVLIYCSFQDVVWSGTVEIPQTSYANSSTAQSQFVARYLNHGSLAEEVERERKEHSTDLLVTGSGYDYVDLRLSAFNMLAYHWQDLEQIVIECIGADYPQLRPVDFPENVDMELFALGVMGTSLEETGSSGGVDIPEWGGNGAVVQKEWNALTEEQKIAALYDPLYMVNRWSKSYDYYANALVGKWGYGLYQWTAERRIVLADLWTKSGYDLSTIDGQMLMVVAEAMGVSTWRDQYAHVFSLVTTDNFPLGYKDPDYKYATAIFWSSCVSGSATYSISTIRGGAAATRNDTLVRDKYKVDGVDWYTIYKTYIEGDVTDVAALFAK